jgi:hypothetical protein
MNEVDPFSLVTVPVQQLANGKPLNSATAFVWWQGQQYYLITNWHVVTGRNHQTGALETIVRPDALHAQFNLATGTFGKRGAPLVAGLSCSKSQDRCAIPLPMRGDEFLLDLYPINLITSKPLRIRVGMEVFILGYPFGASPPAFPVWKRRTIASEPDLVRLTQGYYLVDTASRPGMSGAPVILRSWTNDFIEGGMRALSDNPATNLIGLFG